MSGSLTEKELEARSEYFDMLAEMGVTKHFGSLNATTMLADLSHIGRGTSVLDVGCGVGLTPAYLVKRYRCRVVGLDLTPKMLVRAREELRDRHLTDSVSLVAGDALALPFSDGQFDVTMAESVAVFFPDRALGFREYARVTKPGGYVAVTEATWLESPGRDADAFMGAFGAVALDLQDWVGLMAQAGLEDIVAHAHRMDLPSEARGRLERFGVRSLARIVNRAVRAVLFNRRARTVIRRASGTVPKRVLSRAGYGIIVGRKP